MGSKDGAFGEGDGDGDGDGDGERESGDEGEVGLTCDSCWECCSYCCSEQGKGSVDNG